MPPPHHQPTAATVTVNNLLDPAPGGCATTGTGTCSLREAVIYANAHSGTTISVPIGTITLKIGPVGADDATTGDLNLTAAVVTITGAGSTKTIIDGSGINPGTDRIFHVETTSTATITGVTVQKGNVGGGTGGGILNDGILSLVDVAVLNNKSGQGGGITTAFAPASLSIDQSTIAGNNSNGGSGGGIQGAGGFTMTRSTVSGNTGAQGSGIFAFQGTTSITNSTISSNPGVGSGFQNDGATVTLTFVTITLNNINGIFAQAGTTTLKGTIVTDGCNGALVDSDYNLDAHNTCAFSKPHDIVNQDPLLGPLQVNAPGIAATHALPANSPAVDKGGTSVNGCPTTDENGTTRPQGTACDIGAFEFSASSGTGGLQFFPLSAPVRLLDTRGLHAFKNPPTLTAGQTLNLPGRFSFDGVTVPSAAVALVGNATVDNSKNPVPAGFATLFPSGGSLPLASNLNFVPGTVRPNAFTVGLGADGNFNLFSNTGGNFVIDVTGYYAPPSAGGLFFHPFAQPVRLLDTRAGQTASRLPVHR